MTFDEELRRAFDTLTDRLRDELDRHARTVADELARTARAERDEAVAQAEAALRAERDKAVADAQAALRAERDRAVADTETALRAEHGEAIAQKEEALRAERDRAVADAEAAVRAEADARAEAVAREEAAARADAIAQAEAAARADATAQAEAAIRERPGAAPTAVEPFVADDSASLATLADGIRRMAAATTLRGVLDALVDAAAGDGATAGIWLLRDGRLMPLSPGADADALSLDDDRVVAAAARNNAPALRDGSESAFPLTLAGDVVAVVGISAAAAPGGGRLRSSETLEVLARYASRALEAITAFKTARALVQAPAEPASRPAALSSEATSAEEHASAQRYARLLVCEIKLYHEAEVMDGRRDRDLVARLGGEIAHARVMYEQRVPRHVRERADYFHDELVRTLANGDATLLELRT